MKLQHLLAASAAFAASVYSGYQYAKPLKSLPATEDQENDGSSSSSAFDRLAPVYDCVVGNEERYMFYGMMRSWLLRKAQGDVLEISAGTGRNLPHYRYSSISSLTLADISTAMLQQAQAKFFDELQLQYKQPQVGVKFVLADAENMVAADGQATVTVQLPPARTLRPGARAVSAAAAAAGGVSSGSKSVPAGEQQQHQEQQQQRPDAAGSSIWRFKNKQQQDNSSSDGFSADDDRGSAAAAATAHSSVSGASSNSSAADSSSYETPSASASSSSSSSWWRRRSQGQQELSNNGCTCRHGTSAVADGSSNASSSSAAHLSTFAPHSFDTVVDTFGLCSCQDPVQALRQAALLLKPGGRLLLLEHGLSSWDFLNRHMAERAGCHYKTYGCWYNRDILAIVQQAGLELQSSGRWHFGTSYLIVASKEAAAPVAAGPG